MKIVCISDTHTLHGKVGPLPKGDLLIHAGDFLSSGSHTELPSFMLWIAERAQEYPLGAVLIAGNHDKCLDPDPRHSKGFYHLAKDSLSSIPNVYYLEDSGCTIGGLKIWGSPVSPFFFDWAFNRQRGAEIKRHWDMIPMDTDILVTHGPPLDMLDFAAGRSCGCEDLLHKVELVKPKLHVFGHIHYSHGRAEKDGTVFVNASMLNERYNPVNLPIEVELE
jgi:predicted phosphodiesterase